MTQPQQQQVLGSQNERPSLRMPDTDNYPKGPAIGEAIPDFTLPDQRGNQVRFSEVRGKGQALVTFHRSARW